MDGLAWVRLQALIGTVSRVGGQEQNLQSVSCCWEGCYWVSVEVAATSSSWLGTHAQVEGCVSCRGEGGRDDRQLMACCLWVRRHALAIAVL